MSLEIIKKFAEESGNEDLVKAVGTVEDTIKGNVEKMSFLERDLKGAIDKRDSIKSLVKSKLGINELSEEALDNVLKSKPNVDNEIKAREEMISKLSEELKLSKKELNSKVNTYNLEKQLMSLGAMSETETTKAYDIVFNEISKSADFDENGNIIFKNSDGTTIRNADGSQLSLKDRYNMLKESDEYSFLFKTKRSKAGAGSSGGKSAGGQANLSRSAMSYADKAKFIAEHGQEAYLKLNK